MAFMINITIKCEATYAKTRQTVDGFPRFLTLPGQLPQEQACRGSNTQPPGQEKCSGCAAVLRPSSPTGVLAARLPQRHQLPRNRGLTDDDSDDQLLRGGVCAHSTKNGWIPSLPTRTLPEDSSLSRLEDPTTIPRQHRQRAASFSLF